MKRNIHKVLRSQAGASISFALLLFLVCSVVGALVLTAGTTAAGRMKNLAEMDQRYYSVSSAASLLAQELDGGKVTITRERILTTKTTTNYKPVYDAASGRAGVEKVGDPATGTSAEYSTRINDTDPLEASMAIYVEDGGVQGDDEIKSDRIGSFLTNCAVDLLFNLRNCNSDSAMDASMKSGNALSGEFEMDFKRSDGSTPKYLRISGSYEMRRDGTLILEFQNQEGRDKYAMRVTLHAKINETESESTSSTTKRVDAGEGYAETVTSTNTLTKLSEISWTLAGIEKGSN